MNKKLNILKLDSKENFEILYDFIYKTSKKIKQKFNYNSDELWEHIIADVNMISVELKWNPDILYNGSNYNIYGDKILMLPEYYINGKYEQIRVEKNHYFIQIVRIPLQNQNQLTYEILLKLAMYNGLLSASLNNNDFPEGIVRLYKNMHLYKLSTYVNPTGLTIDSIIINNIKEKLNGLINSTKIENIIL